MLRHVVTLPCLFAMTPRCRQDFIAALFSMARLDALAARHAMPRVAALRQRYHATLPPLRQELLPLRRISLDAFIATLIYAAFAPPLIDVDIFCRLLIRFRCHMPPLAPCFC